MSAEAPSVEQKNKNEILDVTDLFTAAKDANKHFHAYCWFRGHADADWKLQPHIFRETAATDFEMEMAEFFMQEAPASYDRCPRESDKFGWLSLMCHYGLPTRLLDWTKSILVAALFATEERKLKKGEEDTDAAIWALTPIGLVIQMTELRSILMPDSIAIRELAGNAFMGKQADHAVLPVVPKKIDQRMLLQQSRFTLHGSGMLLEESNAADCLLRFTIPKRCKARIHIGLCDLAITRSSLFPDLSSLATEIADSGSLVT